MFRHIDRKFRTQVLGYAMISCLAETHSNLDVHHDLLITESCKVLIELNSTLLESHNDTRSTKLEKAKLVSLLNNMSFFFDLVMDPFVM